jgi:hypothetical protein
MPMYFYPEGFSEPSGGVTPTLAPQDTDAAARQAVEPQAFGDEFRPKPHPDIDNLTTRYDELERECSSLCDKLYMRKPGSAPLTWSEQEDIHDRLRKCDFEKGQIGAELRRLWESSPQDKDEGDGTQPFKGDAQVIGA